MPMEAFLNPLIEFLFNPRGLDLSSLPLGRLVFAAATALLGSLIVVCDWLVTKVRGTSALGLNYVGWLSALRHLLLWGLGSGAVGFVGTALGLAQLTIQSSISIALTWSVLFPKMLSEELSRGPNGEAREAVESYDESEE